MTEDPSAPKITVENTLPPVGLRPMKVLFILLDTGLGHRSTAEAVGSALEAVSDYEISYEILDLFQAADLPILKGFGPLYGHASSKCLGLYNSLYRLTNSRTWVRLTASTLYTVAGRQVRSLFAALRPDLVIVTHPLLLAHLAHSACRDLGLPTPVVTLVTDLCSAHASWACPAADLLVVSTHAMERRMLELGISPTKLHLAPFPVDPKFRNLPTKQEARRSLGVNEENFTILVTGGGAGAGHITKTVGVLEHVDPPKQLLVATGWNNGIYRRLKAGDSHIKVYRSCKFMPLLYAASDIVVGKAGPSTIAEAAVSGRPLLVTAEVGVQEQGNALFVEAYHLGFQCSTHESLVARVRELASLDAISRPNCPSFVDNGAEKIAHLVVTRLQFMSETSEKRAP